MTRSIIALDIDGTLIDTRGSFNRIVKEMTGATDDELLRFRNTGGFNDDWELTRGLKAWIAAGRPKIVERCDTLAELLLWCGAQNDPGDQSAECIARYRGERGFQGVWQDEPLLVDGARLDALAERVELYACTGRDAWEFDRAEQRLGFTFARATTREQAKKPDPRALLRLLDDHATPDVVVLVGDTMADRLTIKHARKARPELRFEFVFVDETHPASAFIDALLDDGVSAAVARFAEQHDQGGR